MAIRSFDALYEHVSSRPPCVLCIAGGAEKKVIESAVTAVDKGLVQKVIVSGDKEGIGSIITSLNADEKKFEIRDASDFTAIARLAVSAVSNGEADILMKGNVDSASYFKAILHKDMGLRNSKVLSNISFFEMDSYHKLIAVTDNGLIPEPNLDEKKNIIENTWPVFSSLQINKPKVALVAASEKISSAMQSTQDAAELKSLHQSGEMGRFNLDGPFGYDVCISREAAQQKNINSDVAGDCDLLLFHNLEAANALGKALKFHGNAKSGGLVLGAGVPVMLNSRSDDAKRRLNSLLLAMAVSKGNKSSLLKNYNKVG